LLQANAASDRLALGTASSSPHHSIRAVEFEVARQKHRIYPELDILYTIYYFIDAKNSREKEDFLNKLMKNEEEL
jgi:hypothetical protein